MSIPDPTFPLPEALVGEESVFDLRSAGGLFAFRHLQARNLLHPPHFSDAPSDPKQLSEFSSQYVSLQRPLLALVLFLGVVAHEDLIRDLAARLVGSPLCVSRFPGLEHLKQKKKNDSMNTGRSGDRDYRDRYTDPAGKLDPQYSNDLFQRAIGVQPIPVEDYWHLRDLALLRHTVAHHGAIIREVDQRRFAHFIVTPGRLINPPPDFVRAELDYLYALGRDIEQRIRTAMFGRFIAEAGPGWSRDIPDDIYSLIELFGYFGHLEAARAPVGHAQTEPELGRMQEADRTRIRGQLLQRCVSDLVGEFGD